ncbi:MAG: hypothetical protein P9M11_08890 [Candidatus Tenebribacter burtonii]|jgi:hypothetical protein|nr:hypothetical protein [Candidatus Tenebribacter burtonii]
MYFKNNIIFAIRTIKMYNTSKQETDFEYTLVIGALLNVFSAIYPNNEFLINLNNLTKINFPTLHNPDYTELKAYLTNLRNGLAHKTDINFINNTASESTQIFEVKITSNNGKSYRFSLDDLNCILTNLTIAIKDEFPVLYVAEHQ